MRRMISSLVVGPTHAPVSAQYHFASMRPASTRLLTIRAAATGDAAALAQDRTETFQNRIVGGEEWSESG
jgi:hypothetical protein